jgi:TolB-like protein/DNA-binding CsgD family transcriptional regulator
MLDGNVQVGRLSELSDRECLVATKFAQGMTHREIGEALFIASSTVRTHLAAIYRKLGIHNKAALANLFAAFQPPTSASVSFAENHYDGRGRPVVLMLPFENLSADERWTRIAEGFSADLMVDLARYPDLAVVALQTLLSANGSATGGEGLRADYLLEGSLQAVGSRVRVCVRLADALNGVSLWAIRSDRSTEDLLSVQDGVVESVINAVAGCEGKLANHRREAIRGRPPADLGAYDCYLLGAEQHRKGSRVANQDAIRLLSMAVELDPEFARAWAVLGDAHSVAACNGFSSSPSISIELWGDCLRRAVALDPDDGFARLSMGDFRALRGDFDGAAEEQGIALATAPNDGDTLAMLAGSRTLVIGDTGQAYELAKQAVRLNPRTSCTYGMLGRSSFVVGRYRESLSALQHAQDELPTTLMFRAMGHAMLGEMNAARAVVGKLVRNVPGFSVNGFIQTYPVTNPPALAALREGARRAGLQ